MPSGYDGRVLQTLDRHGAGVGDRVAIDSDIRYTGTIMPRYHHSDDSHIVLKLDSGYNVGVSIRGITGIRILERRPAAPPSPPPPEPRGELPDILLVSTGGTIASRIDYRTGAVTPALDAAQLGGSMPELYGMANIRPMQLLSEYSENITPEHWLEMAGAIHEEHSKYAGIVLAHGTDTMHYTAAYLSFALAGCDTPIVLTGSQRSSDRASSDAALNLAGAVSAIAQGIPRGVYIAMHHTQSDDTVAIHHGTRARKSHASARGAFRTINGEPAYVVRGGALEGRAHSDYWNGAPYSPAISVDPQAVALVKYHPGYDTALLDHISEGCRAVILEGTGLGHVGREAYHTIRSMVRQGVFVGMTTQCIEGSVRMTVYESGRDLLDIGVTPLRMIPETALVKAMWAASRDMDMHDAMVSETASEMA